MKRRLFLLFSGIECATLAVLIYLALTALQAAGLDARILLSIIFPLFVFIVQYFIYDAAYTMGE